jgi:hypothetical protein
VQRFVAMGVDGFSTNNLAVMEAIGTPSSETALVGIRVRE